MPAPSADIVLVPPGVKLNIELYYLVAISLGIDLEHFNNSKWITANETCSTPFAVFVLNYGRPGFVNFWYDTTDKLKDDKIIDYCKNNDDSLVLKKRIEDIKVYRL